MNKNKQDETTGNIAEIRKERIAKGELLKQAGQEPYAASTERDTTLAEFTEQFDTFEKSGEQKVLAGRVMAKRGHGALIFIDLYDGTGRVQSVVKADEMDAELHELFAKTVDTGDFIELSGTAFTTQRGAQSLLAKEWKMLTKSLLPLPKEHFGIKDEDERYRKRYLDMILNEEVAKLPALRSKYWNTMRSFLLKRGYIEVETPILENTVGGGEASPFITHHNALDIDVYLRISPELWHKKLMVAGVPKVFEIGRIFRNEGMDAEHLQDYTQMECYEAYMNFNDGKEMVVEMYRELAQSVLGSTKFTTKGYEIDLSKDWEDYHFCEIIKERFNIDPLEVTGAEVQAKLTELNIKFDPKATGVGRGVDMLWKSIRKEYAGPGFLIGIPKFMEPLAKPSKSDPRLVERFQPILAGSEVGKAFNELNDPTDQLERFTEQQAQRDAGDDEAQMADDTFVEALEHGMPPTFGFGAPERFFSILMDASMRETSLFPLMRPKA
jgi:lysyl-tRNA synthetase class 2